MCRLKALRIEPSRRTMRFRMAWIVLFWQEEPLRELQSKNWKRGLITFRENMAHNTYLVITWASCADLLHHTSSSATCSSWKITIFQQLFRLLLKISSVYLLALSVCSFLPFDFHKTVLWWGLLKTKSGGGRNWRIGSVLTVELGSEFLNILPDMLRLWWPLYYERWSRFAEDLNNSLNCLDGGPWILAAQLCVCVSLAQCKKKEEERTLTSREHPYERPLWWDCPDNRPL